ncbi:hypothetical protein PF005_g6513 [Phytophthora fragariae]|uniref:RxLR effector protein n=1 Tax=Phytophthora fragariae TaxID=53985 RepID=A0A6A3FU63_9STRA|nr:hypothetical protein PF003_g24186 [Phytophthora fragariae]KAE8949745.1 hypothetical protein PF009_g728 [Phytophthora fragariae]KAE9019971.1 hypothetical protein PF011_g5615 [Phytophthora fragariae]KAE9125333.1 hypothetical protein PF007_g6389 [Phytophthora fragariae]KAE9149874.1 hypothetical protein PF006_g5688 [Phytophthora fragariae]
MPFWLFMICLITALTMTPCIQTWWGAAVKTEIGTTQHHSVLRELETIHAHDQRFNRNHHVIRNKNPKHR